MAASADDIARLRRMVNEPTEDTYTDELLHTYLEAWPLLDSHGRNFENDNWTEAYDLHAAAADIWDEKAALIFDKHDFSADGANYSSNQMHENAVKQSNRHRAMQKAQVKRMPITTKTGTYYPNYVNPVFDEDETSDWNDYI